MNSDLVDCPDVKQNGFDQPHRRWVTINLLRTEHGKPSATGYEKSNSMIFFAPIQSLKQIVTDVLAKFNELSQNVIDWLDNF